jgi:hypothetical protein
MVDFSNGLFFLVIAMTFSDLLNVIISPSSSRIDNQGFTSLGRSSPRNKNKLNSKYHKKLQNSSETAASSQKGMLPSNDISDDENHIQINDFQTETTSSSQKSSLRRSHPDELFTVREATTLNEMTGPSMVLNTQHHVQIPRRSSDVFFPQNQIASSRISTCLLVVVFVLLVLLKYTKIGVVSALILGLFLRICVKSCNGFCMECTPIECLDKSLGDRNVCGIGFFPSPRLAAKRKMEKERIYREICAEEQRNEDSEKNEELQEKSSIGYVSMQIDRNVLYQRFLI